MKVHAHFPTACRAEQTVHAPAERPSGGHVSEAGGAPVPGVAPHGRTLPGVLPHECTLPGVLPHECTLPGVLRRRHGRAFASTRPHRVESTGPFGIGA